jgi:hypothetical protein
MVLHLVRRPGSRPIAWGREGATVRARLFGTERPVEALGRRRTLDEDRTDPGSTSRRLRSGWRRESEIRSVDHSDRTSQSIVGITVRQQAQTRRN